MPPPRAVVFDLDGLMFNTEELYQEVGTELLRRRGYEFTQELLDQMMGRPSHIALQMMIDTHTLKATVEELLAETDEIFPEILRTRLAPMPGLVELLDALERHAIPKAIATSSRRAFVERVLGHLRLSAAVFAHPHFGRHHPRQAPPGNLSESRRAAGHRRPREMLVLEDSQNGCRSAVAAGAITVAVPGGHSTQHDFPARPSSPIRCWTAGSTACWGLN